MAIIIAQATYMQQEMKLVEIIGPGKGLKGNSADLRV